MAVILPTIAVANSLTTAAAAAAADMSALQNRALEALGHLIPFWVRGYFNFSFSFSGFLVLSFMEGFWRSALFRGHVYTLRRSFGWFRQGLYKVWLVDVG